MSCVNRVEVLGNVAICMQDVNNPALRHGWCFDLGFGGIGLVATYIRKRKRVSRGSENESEAEMQNGKCR